MSYLRFLFASLAATFALTISASSQTNSPTQSNWMREYVQLRVKAQFEHVTGTSLSSISKAAPIGTKIVGGATASKSLHKFQVGLLNKSISNDYDAQFCGGTLVSSQYIVTAAHCSDFTSAGDVAVLVGTQVLSTQSTGRRINVSRISIHSLWDSNTFDNDVAVWKLSEPVLNVPTAYLASEGNDPTGSATVTGWGTTKYLTSNYPTKLRSVSIPIVNRSTCNAANSYNGDVTTNMFCAGKSGKDSCQGDSGGPITLNPNNNTLIGIVSWGSDCGLKNYPGIYTRISSQSINSFIRTATLN